MDEYAARIDQITEESMEVINRAMWSIGQQERYHTWSGRAGLLAGLAMAPIIVAIWFVDFWVMLLLGVAVVLHAGVVICMREAKEHAKAVKPRDDG